MLTKRALSVEVTFILIVLSVVVYWKWPWLLGSRPAFPSPVPSSVVFSVREGLTPTPTDTTAEFYVRTNTTEPACAAVLTVLREGRKSQEHRCMNYGSLILHYAAGGSSILGILPGHHADRYEFRYNHALYSVPRNDFISAMKSMGVPESKIPLQ